MNNRYVRIQRVIVMDDVVINYDKYKDENGQMSDEAIIIYENSEGATGAIDSFEGSFRTNVIFEESADNE
jgi:hypothetical protein